jgi:hypothetical protein
VEFTDSATRQIVFPGNVPAYLVERYVPGSPVEQVQASADRLAKTGERIACDGIAVTYLGSTFLPGDEAVFDVIVAPSLDAVAAVNQQAGTVAARISEAILITPRANLEADPALIEVATRKHATLGRPRGSGYERKRK